MNEMIEIINGFASGEYFEYHGEFYDLDAMKMCPVPEQRVPILIGGHSDMALTRAARLGDGWMHAGGDAEDLARMMAVINERRAEHGRADDRSRSMRSASTPTHPRGSRSWRRPGSPMSSSVSETPTSRCRHPDPRREADDDALVRRRNHRQVPGLKRCDHGRCHFSPRGGVSLHQGALQAHRSWRREPDRR